MALRWREDCKKITTWENVRLKTKLFNDLRLQHQNSRLFPMKLLWITEQGNASRHVYVCLFMVLKCLYLFIQHTDIQAICKNLEENLIKTKQNICCRDILLFHHDLGIQTKSGVFRVRGAFRLRRCRLEGLPKKHSGIATLFKSTNSFTTLVTFTHSLTNGEFTYLVSCRPWDERMDTTLMSVQ